MVRLAHRGLSFTPAGSGGSSVLPALLAGDTGRGSPHQRPRGLHWSGLMLAASLGLGLQPSPPWRYQDAAGTCPIREGAEELLCDLRCHRGGGGSCANSGCVWCCLSGLRHPSPHLSPKHVWVRRVPPRRAARHAARSPAAHIQPLWPELQAQLVPAPSFLAGPSPGWTPQGCCASSPAQQLPTSRWRQVRAWSTSVSPAGRCHDESEAPSAACATRPRPDGSAGSAPGGGLQ